MVDDVLVDRGAGRDEDRDARPRPPAGPPELLPGRGDRARVAGHDRHVEPADVDAELERVGGDDAEDLAVAQPALDRPALGRQVAAAVAPDPTARAAALAQRLAQPGQQQLHGDPRAPEHDRLATGAQERQGPALGEGQGRAARPARRVEHGRVDQHEMALARRRAGPIDDPDRATDQRRASSPGFPIVAEQHTMTGWLP